MKWTTWKVRNLALKAIFHFLQLCSFCSFEIVSWQKVNLLLSGVVSSSYFSSKVLFLFSILVSVRLGQILYWIGICFHVEPRVHKWLTSVYVKPTPYEICWACTFLMQQLRTIFTVLYRLYMCGDTCKVMPLTFWKWNR